MNIKLFSHNDLDGIGCAILAKISFSDVDVEYCNYDDVDDKIMQCDYSKYDQVFITDISVNEETAKFLNKVNNEELNQNCEIQLLDHHQTALWLNEYSWAMIKVFYEKGWEEDKKASGVTLFADYLIENDKIISSEYSIYDFVETIRRYDTWEWATKFNDEEPKKWNDLLKIMGKEKFINKIVSMLNKGYFLLNETDELLLELEQEKIGRYVEKKEEYMFEKEVMGYKLGIVFAEQYISELGNKLHERNKHLDAIAMINPNYAVSYRTIKDDVDVSKIASKFGGGGHPNSSGNPIDEEDKERFIKQIFLE